MAIRPVTYYEAVCDDCGLWVNAGGYSGEFGEFCLDHHPRCPHGVWQEDYKVDDACEECDTQSTDQEVK